MPAPNRSTFSFERGWTVQKYMWTALAVLVLFGSGAGPARQDPPPAPPAPQEDAAALRRQVELLERELAAARARIAELEAEIERLRAERSGGGEGEAAVRGEGPPASPHDVLARFKAIHAEAFPDPSPTDPRELRQHLRLLTQWANMINREHRQRLDWTCRIVSREALDGDHSFVDLEAIDPVSGEAVSERFVIEWPRRLAPALARFADGSPIRVRGLFTPDLRVNEARREAGVFDIPPLIGPYLEFRYALQVTAVSAAEIGPPADQPTPPPPAPQPEGEKVDDGPQR